MKNSSIHKECRLTHLSRVVWVKLMEREVRVTDLNYLDDLMVRTLREYWVTTYTYIQKVWAATLNGEWSLIIVLSHQFKKKKENTDKKEKNPLSPPPLPLSLFLFFFHFTHNAFILIKIYSQQIKKERNFRFIRKILLFPYLML